MKELCNENSKTLKNNVEYTLQYGKHPMLVDWEDLYCESDCPTESKLQIQLNTIKNSMLHRKDSTKIVMGEQKTNDTQRILNKESTARANSIAYHK